MVPANVQQNRIRNTACTRLALEQSGYVGGMCSNAIHSCTPNNFCRTLSTFWIGMFVVLLDNACTFVDRQPVTTGVALIKLERRYYTEIGKILLVRQQIAQSDERLRTVVTRRTLQYIKERTGALMTPPRTGGYQLRMPATAITMHRLNDRST